MQLLKVQYKCPPYAGKKRGREITGDKVGSDSTGLRPLDNSRQEMMLLGLKAWRGIECGWICMQDELQICCVFFGGMGVS